MEMIVGFGTPSHIEERKYTTPSQAKSFLDDKVNERLRWARKYSPEIVDALTSIHEEVQQLKLGQFVVGDENGWQARDPLSGVEFVFRIRKTKV